MIIKSLSRKTPSFGQLLRYISKDAEPVFEIRRNMPPFGSMDDVRQRFEEHAKAMPRRKNGNMLYHEILSLKREPFVDPRIQQEALHALAHEYLNRRAPEQLAFGQLHLEEEHIHMHLMLSANSVDAPQKRVRLAKEDFQEIQRGVEAWLAEAYPQVNQQKVYEKKGSRFTFETEKEYQQTRRTKRPSRKAQMRLGIEHLLFQAESQQDFEALLAQYGMEFYKRGSVPGIKANNRKYRLSTLGIEEQYTKLPYEKGRDKRPQEKLNFTSHEEPAPSAIKEDPLKTEPQSSRMAKLSAERLATLLRDLFTYSPDMLSFADGLKQYGITLEERGGQIWCVHEALEAPLVYMGLEKDYTESVARFRESLFPEKTQKSYDNEQPSHSSRLQRLQELDKRKNSPELDFDF